MRVLPLAQVMYQGRHYRFRRVKDVADEMEVLVRQKGFRSVYFDDDTFNIGKERMLDLCREFKSRGLDRVPWAIMARPDLMDKEILTRMKEAGLWAVKYGVESASQALVDRIGKQMDLDAAARMIVFTKKLGIKVHLTFTFGLPGETWKTIDETIAWARKLDPFSLQFSITTPFPGTAYHKALEEKGFIVSRDFSSYDGNFRSVIRTESLSPEDLTAARAGAIRIWQEHVDDREKIKRAGVLGRAKRFRDYIRMGGLVFAVRKAADYFRLQYVFSKRRRVVEEHTATRPGGFGNTKADILLIQCPPWDTLMPPLSLGYLAEYLKKRGREPLVYDLNVDLYHAVPQELKYLWDHASYDAWTDPGRFPMTRGLLEGPLAACLKNALEKSDAECIGLSVNFTGLRFAAEVLRVLAQTGHGSKIIVGGWGCVTDHMRAFLPQETIDAFVLGEGEETLIEVMDALREHREPEGVPGAIFPKNNGAPYRPRPPIRDLDSIPWPTFSGFDLSRYQTRSLPLLMSRGCIGQCSFCNDWPQSKPYRVRSARNVFDEVRYHLEKNRTDVFSFKDLACNGNIRELGALCDLIIGSGLKIRWDSNAICRREMTYELLCRLKKSGCESLMYGVESFSDNVLKRMNKNLTRRIAEQVIEDTYRAGIRASVNIIVGFPGETEADFRETMDALRRIRKHIVQVCVLSVCLINNDSMMDKDPQSFGIRLSLDPNVRAKQWTSMDGLNTYESRKDKARKIGALLEELCLPTNMKTL